MAADGSSLVVVELQTHAVMDLIVSKCDMIFVNSVPLLNTDFVRTRASLGSNQLLQVSNSVVLTARATCQSVHSGIAGARAAGVKS